MRPENLKGGQSVGMLWRFLVADDETVDYFIVRDSDSRLNARDRFAVEEWINSGKSAHMARDHPYHKYAMNGGSWGGTKGMLRGKKMMTFAEAFLKSKNITNDGWGSDILFLCNNVYPIVKDDIMSHDAYYCFKYGAKAFPTKRDDNWQHFGQVFDSNDQPVKRHIAYIKKYSIPEECRPINHKDWFHG